MGRHFEPVNTSEGVPGEGVKLPTRGTEGSAGYDFYSPCDVDIEPYETEKVRTYVRAKFPKGEVFLLFIRSSMAIKHGIILANGVGVIDADYYGNKDNGGEIIGALYNTTPYTFHLKAGERFMQGIFMPYLEAQNMETAGTRSGGIGSTGK